MAQSVHSPAVDVDESVPDRIGKYVIINEVGRGSTGVVYLSHDPYYGRDVAIKVYKSPQSMPEERARIARKMFLSEAHMVGMLHHANILPIYDAGEENGRCYIVTEHVHGARTLSDYCHSESLLRLDQVVEIIFKCAKALHYAHSRGVIHRDIKPSNILLTHDGDVRIIDFGIALVAGSDVSSIEGVAGSPSYMSPEQVQGLEISNRSDLYSLGAVMYELLTGDRLFRAGTLARLLHQIVYSTPPPIHLQRPEVPEDLEGVVAQVLRKDPLERYRNGAELAAALTRVHQRLRLLSGTIDQTEQLRMLRMLKFFHDFSQSEIHEVLQSGSWQEFVAGDHLVRQGELDDRLYIIISGDCQVERNNVTIGRIGTGDCFGEASYVSGAIRQATVRAVTPVTALSVSSTLLEQVSASCQLRFNRVFLRSLIQRLQGIERFQTG